MHLLHAATLTSPDVEATASRYQQWLNYHIVERGEIATDLAQSWGAAASGGRRYVVMQPASGVPVYLRFVEGAGHPAYRPLRTYGWAAIEICVQDVLAVNAQMERSPFEIIGPPRELDGLPAIFPMQVRGPDQEILYLTQIRADLPDYDLPRARTLIDRPFIVVLACSDMRASLRWFERTLGIRTGREMEILYTMISNSFGMPATHKHRLATGVHERDCFMEFVQYPDLATARPSMHAELKPGVALATFAHPDMEKIVGEWITPPQPRGGVLYDGRRTGTLAAPDGSLIEVVDAR